MQFAKWLFVLLFAFSCTAAAQPVRITSQLSGDLLFQNPIVLQHIGHGDYFGFTGDAMPFDLTISAIVDPEAVSTFGNESQARADVNVTLAMGGTTSHFSAPNAFIRLGSDPAAYRMEVTFGIGSYTAWFTTRMQGPPGSFDGSALAPQVVVQGDGMTSLVEIMTYPSHTSIPYSWRTGSPGNAARLDIVSAVPEPANAAMSCVGLLALAWAGRRRTGARK